MLMCSQIGSVMFDVLFVLVQQEMDQDCVDVICDFVFDEGWLVFCECFQIGVCWFYVWMCDVSFVVDLVLVWLDLQCIWQLLQFKLLVVCDGYMFGLFVVQDIGFGGSWLISSDCVVWFLVVCYLLEDCVFVDQVWQVLQGMLVQDCVMVFDVQMGLYRGEIFFLDWCEQIYLDWICEDVCFIGDFYVLFINVLYYQVLCLVECLVGQYGDVCVIDYKVWVDVLVQQIDVCFWCEDIGQYMSYIGEVVYLVLYVKVDLFGFLLGIFVEVLLFECVWCVLVVYLMGLVGSLVVWLQEV